MPLSARLLTSSPSPHALDLLGVFEEAHEAPRGALDAPHEPGEAPDDPPTHRRVASSLTPGGVTRLVVVFLVG